MSEPIKDKVGRVRKGEEINPQVIADYLRQHLSHLEGIPTILQFKGGASNLTYRLDFDNDSLILRRPPMGTKAKSAHNMGREFDIMKRLDGHYPVPKMLHFCEDPEVIGSEFYVMERLKGYIPRTRFDQSLQLSPEQVRAICVRTLDEFVNLHQLDYKAIGFEDYYRGEGYVKRQVEGWNRRFRKARTPDVPDCEKVMNWLVEKMPEDVGASIIHNDYRFDNMVYDQKDLTQVMGVLDWEMATVGDPLMDFGGSLAYWIQADDPRCMKLLSRQPTQAKGMMTRDEVVAHYMEKSGLSTDNIKYYYIFGLFRLAGIIQQIYYRYYHKQTTNPAFSTFGVAVEMLEAYCSKLIDNPTQDLSPRTFNWFEDIRFTLRFMRKQKKS
ncbi:MAG: phosphotransferase family protein [Bacteroidota bacterium]